MRGAGIWKVTTDTPSPWLWQHSSQVLIDVPEIHACVQIDTNGFLSNTWIWCLFLLLPSCLVMLSYVFKEDFSWAITSLGYASCSSQEQAELQFPKNRLVGDAFFSLVLSDACLPFYRLGNATESFILWLFLVEYFRYLTLPISNKWADIRKALTISVGSLTFWKCASFYHLQNVFPCKHHT